MARLEATLHRDLYLESSWFDRERESIFYDQWFCICREDDLPSAGSYRLFDVAGASVLLVRGKDERLRGFHNVCRHRGCQLVDSTKADRRQGRFPARIRCPYHSWTYNLDGSLQHTPHVEIDRKQFGLYDVRLDTWGGFVFLKLGTDGASLADQLGAIPARVRRYPLDRLVAGWSYEYDVAANWKVILENYNECYHCAGVHPELCRIVPAFRRNGGSNLDWDAGVPQKSGTNTYTTTGTTSRPPFPDLSDAEKERHFGELAYPNLMLSLSMDHAAMFILWPTGPESTRIDCRLLFWPETRNSPDFDPSDAGDFWHLVNGQDWEICERVQRGMHARPFRHGLYAPMEDLSLDIRNYIAGRLQVELPSE